jgi:Na+/H+-dicarboxylate symporter/ABC-type amino acid transport substrate-binding protein
MSDRWNLKTKIFAGLISGILVGLFFGDLCSALEPVSSGFIKIWQITIIPFIVVSLLLGVGGLKQADARDTVAKVGSVLLFFWVVGLAAFFSLQMAFPSLERASFFSTTELQKADDITGVIDLFIPYNPFHSLSEGLLPAIVVFCLCLGFALIEDENSMYLMNVLNTLNSAFIRINRLIMKTFPVGVLIITAEAAGSLTLESFQILLVFIISLALISILLSFIVLPLLITSFTTFSYRDILSKSSDAVILGFSTGSDFITLPTIVEGLKDLYRNSQNREKAESYSDVLVPLGYTFPLLGAMVPLLYILYTSWSYDSPFNISDQIKLIIIGIPSIFGSSKLSVGFLLDAMQLPMDAFNLYLSMGILRASFVAGLTSMSIFSFATIGIAILTGSFKIKFRRMIISIIIIIAIFAIAIIGMKAGFTYLLSDTYHGDDIISSMDLPKQADGKRLNEIIETKVYLSQEEVTETVNAALIKSEVQDGALRNGLIEESTLNKIYMRNALKVGYNANCIPFVFLNKNGNLVGYDVEMAYDLAQFLGVTKIEFIPIDSDNLIDSLNSGRIDIAMSSILFTAERLRKLELSDPYITAHMAFVVRDQRKIEFVKLQNIQKMENLKIAVLNRTALLEVAPRIFPSATIVEIESFHDFFRDNDADALMTTAEEGFAMTLLYPFYDVAIFEPNNEFQVLYTYSVVKGDDTFLKMVNYWLKVEKQTGGLNKKYDYWILGKNISEVKPRWSVLKDTLHWQLN